MQEKIENLDENFAKLATGCILNGMPQFRANGFPKEAFDVAEWCKDDDYEIRIVVPNGSSLAEIKKQMVMGNLALRCKIDKEIEKKKLDDLKAMIKFDHLAQNLGLIKAERDKEVQAMKPAGVDAPPGLTSCAGWLSKGAAFKVHRALITKLAIERLQTKQQQKRESDSQKKNLKL